MNCCNLLDDFPHLFPVIIISQSLISSHPRNKKKNKSFSWRHFFSETTAQTAKTFPFQSPVSPAKTLRHTTTMTAQPPLLHGEEAPRPVAYLLAPYLSFAEQRRCRLTCQAWNDALKSHPSFLRKATLVLSKSTEEDDLWKRVDIPKYSKARLLACHLQKGKFMQNYWKRHVRDCLTFVELNKVSCRCSFLAQFVNQLGSLTELKLVEIQFKTASKKAPDRVLYCEHTNLLQKFHKTGPRTIRRLTFSGIPVMPTCLIALLQDRCGGHLESLEISDTNMKPTQRATCSPKIDDQTRQYQAMIAANIVTLRKLTWRNNSTMGGSMKFLESRVGPNQLIPWVITDITLEQARDLSESANSITNFLHRVYRNPAETPLTKLNLTFHCSDFLKELEKIMAHPSLRRLREFRLTLNDLSTNIDLAFPFGEMRDLRILEVTQKFKSRTTEKIKLFNNITLRVPRATATPTFLRDNRPNSLESLILDVFGINTILLTPIPQRLLNLRVLHIGKIMYDVAEEDWEEDFDDEDEAEVLRIENARLNRFDNFVQTIFESFQHQLEELAIMDAVRLSDYGLSGIPRVVSKQIAYTKQYGLLLPERKVFKSGRSIADLKRLKKLNLSKCGPTVTDVSLLQIAGNINLRELVLSNLHNNVTDFGLNVVAAQNPWLEKVTLHSTPGISFFGVTQFLQKCKGLVQLQCSKSIIDRTFDGMAIPKEPHDFDSKVKVTC